MRGALLCSIYIHLVAVTRIFAHFCSLDFFLIQGELWLCEGARDFLLMGGIFAPITHLHQSVIIHLKKGEKRYQDLLRREFVAARVEIETIPALKLP